MVAALSGNERFLGRITAIGLAVDYLVEVLRNERKYLVLVYGHEGFELIAGRGVTAVINEECVFAGNEALLKDHALVLPKQAERAAQEEANGATVIYVAGEKAVWGFIALADTLRADAARF